MFSVSKFSILYFLSSIVFFCLLASVFWLPSSLHAQTSLGLSANDISVDLNPENPGPNQQVVATIQSYATDLNASQVTWTINGKQIAKGTGVTKVFFTTGAIGKASNIIILISSPAGDVEKDLTVVPASVDLTWEAHTYIPPFFKGKPLFTYQSAVTFIAIPHIMANGSEVSPSRLEYSWSNNGSVLGDQGGYGRNTLTISGAFIPRPMDITVTATDPNTGLSAAGEITLSPTNPFILFYKNDPLYGVKYENALPGSYNLSNQEITVRAVPYYFAGTSAHNQNLSYNWTINGNPINDGQNSPDKTFRVSGDAGGTSNISLSVSHATAILESAEADLNISFSAPTQTTSF